MKIGFFIDTYLPRKDGATYTVRTWKSKMEERGHEEDGAVRYRLS